MNILYRPSIKVGEPPERGPKGPGETAPAKAGRGPPPEPEPPAPARRTKPAAKPPQKKKR